MKAILRLGLCLFFLAVQLSSCVPLPKTIFPVETTPLTDQPAVLVLGNSNLPRTVKVAVSGNYKIQQGYSSMVKQGSFQVKPAQQQVTFVNVKPGVYYLNLGASTEEWAVDNSRPVTGQHCLLGFNVYVSVNDGPWVTLGSADTEKVSGWWNLKITVP